MLKIRDLSKRFKRRVIFENVNLDLKRGNIYGFVGANGSGKSVFFKTICGFLRPEKGSILIDDMEIGKNIDFLPELGVLIEKPGFIEEYNQLDNLRYLARINNKIGEKEIKDSLEAVGLDIANKDKVKNFSLGMRQRLAIAQAIMEGQKIIILDEPFNGLDKEGVEQIKTLIKGLKSPDRLILLTSHIPGDIEELSDCIFEFLDGNILPV
ncbi:MAG: ATP-binding cassette domain-containing protein [Lachnospiraceae bacterium]|nr:ATP-binding cassette domain-containing protein [Lachnospiraceae bacterium]